MHSDREVLGYRPNPPAGNAVVTTSTQQGEESPADLVAEQLQSQQDLVEECRHEENPLTQTKRQPSKSVEDEALSIEHDASPTGPAASVPVPGYKATRIMRKLYRLAVLDDNGDEEGASDEQSSVGADDASPTLLLNARTGEGGLEALFSTMVDTGCPRANVMTELIARRLGPSAIRPCVKEFKTFGKENTPVPAMGYVVVEIQLPGDETWRPGIKFFVLENAHCVGVTQKAVVGWKFAKEHGLLNYIYSD